ncbi:MAG: hypothetical protein HP496_07085 [Nitrospira sp.]|nr:hypothetical protein [Nitrospira sp.]
MAWLYALIVCGIIIYQSLPRPLLLVVTAVKIFFASVGLDFIWSLDDTPALYRAVFSFSYDNLCQAGPQRIGEHLLQYTMVVVPIVNVQALVVPVVALLATCRTLVLPATGIGPILSFRR